MHKNSLKTYDEERYRLNDRASKIFELLRANPGSSYTDRQIMTRLGFSEPNQVRPRITELIERELVTECGSVKCDVTGKTVRLVKLYTNTNQLEMF